MIVCFVNIGGNVEHNCLNGFFSFIIVFSYCYSVPNPKKGVMVFNASFINMSVISWRSVLLVEVTRVPGENHRPAASH